MLPSKRDFTHRCPQTPRECFFSQLDGASPWWGWHDPAGGSGLFGMARGWVWPGGMCIDGLGLGLLCPALPLHTSSPSRVTLAERKEWMMKTIVLGQE